jgi:hypothetical protein
MIRHSGILTLSFLLLLSISVSGQALTDTTYWTRTLSFGINFNQAAFSNNWRAGGVNSIAIQSLLLAKANYARGPVTWDNLLDLQYGVVNNQGQGVRKTADRILLDSKLGRSLTDKWNLFVAANFQTQFAPGFQYGAGAGGEDLLISDFFAPAFLAVAWGFEYRPVEYFSLRLSPFSPRITIVSNPNIVQNVPENYGVPVGEQVRYEWLAAQIFAAYDRKLNENLHLTARYQLFANYETLAFNTIDHRLDAALTAKVTRYLNFNLTVTGLYDIDQAPGIQFAQTLGIGFLINRGDQPQ